MVAMHCTASQDGTTLLSCWYSPELRLELDRVWAEKGLKPHGRTQNGLDDRIASSLAALREA
jgi:hypothetical protein